MIAGRTMNTRIVIVDEVKLSASLLASVLGEESGLMVVAAVTSPDEALAYVECCDLLLVSTGLPDDGAAMLTARVLSQNPRIQVLVIGVFNAPHRILHHIEAGACGYVLREDSVDELLRNIHAVRRGNALISPNVAALLMARVSELAGLTETPQLEPDADLTNRELEILGLIAQDMTNQEIADRLFIALGTVKNHVHSILQKLNVRSRDEAVAYLDAIPRTMVNQGA